MRKHRNVIAGATSLITKKTMLDEFIIAPSPRINSILLYCLLVAAQRYEIVIHGFCFLSSHFHLVVTDTLGHLPDFMQHFLTNSSKAVKLELRRTGSVWSNDRYSAVRLLDLDAAERKIAYTVLNPVCAGLSARPEDWKGLNSARWKTGDTMRCTRPDVYFSKKGPFPAEVSAPLVSPADAYGEDESGQAASDERIRVLVDAMVDATADERRNTGKKDFDAGAALDASRSQRSSHPVGNLNPRFASTNPETLNRAIEEDLEFHRAHAQAKAEFLAGNRDVEFPVGTYGYRKMFGVRVVIYGGTMVRLSEPPRRRVPGLHG